MTRNLPGPALERLAAAHEVVVVGGDVPPSRADLLEAVASAHGLLSLLTDRVDAELLRAAPRLRAIANYAVGFDNVDVPAATRRGIAIGVTPDVLTAATADLAMALLLAVGRRLPEAARDVREGRWRTWEPAGWLGLGLDGAQLAVVGAGRIGRAVGERAAAFGMVVDYVGRGDDLHAALAAADAVSLHVPLTERTRHLIDARALAAMRSHAVLVNTGRGGLVDQDALVHALRRGAIGGAGLDVTDPEPLPVDHALLDVPGALVVPHIGSATFAARNRMTQMAVENLLAGLAGRPMPFPAPLTAAP